MSDDLVEVGFGEEREGFVGVVVEVGCLVLEFVEGVFEEGAVMGGCEGSEGELFGGETA